MNSLQLHRDLTQHFTQLGLKVTKPQSVNLALPSPGRQSELSLGNPRRGIAATRPPRKLGSTVTPLPEKRSLRR